MTSPVGRADALSQIRSWLAGGSSVVVYGPAGIGKSTVLAAMATRPSDVLVLRAAPVEVESGLPYLTLVDLFDGVGADEMAGLPGHLRAALDSALLRGTEPAGVQDQLAVRLAVLELLRTLASRRPVLLVLDDLQWVDQQSAGVLGFVTRRLEGAGVGMLAAERVDAGATPGHLELCPDPVHELELGPLTEYDVADILRDRYGPVLSLVTIARVHEASGGNPLLAVELGRALVATGGEGSSTEPLPVPERLRPLLTERLASLPPGCAEVLLLAASAARPTRALVATDEDSESALRHAVSAVLVAVDPDGSIRFAHPLLRELVYADADPDARAHAHELLADRVDDVVERARHLALARPYADEDLASRLVDAADTARRRGAPAVAADLAALAAERTPPADTAKVADRRLAAAEHAAAAGLTGSAADLAATALRDAEEPAVRVNARLLLVDLAGQDQSGAGPLLDAALAEAGDDAELLARVGSYRALKAYYDGDIEQATAELKRAEQAAEDCHDTAMLVELLATRATLQFSLGGKAADELLRRASELSRGLPLSSEVVRARQLYAMSRAFAGEMAEASDAIESLRDEVERSGTVRDLAGVLLSVSSIRSRSGRCGQSLRAGRDCMRLMLDMEATPGPGLMVGAAVEMIAGSPARATSLAGQAIEACLAAGDDDWLRGAYATLGQVRLLEGDHQGAVEAMRSAYRLDQRMGRIDPVVFLWYADFIEALTLIGAKDEAAAALEEVRSAADRLGRDVVRLGLERAAALVTAAAGDPRAGADALADALCRAADHPYPFEVARAWHTLGALQRRAHRRAAARRALVEAVGRYAAAEAAPWRAAAQAELDRLDGGQTGLSEIEQRIVALVLTGATNREIARTTYLSVKAIEANLTRLYRRFGVRNRAQLVQAVQRTGYAPGPSLP